VVRGRKAISLIFYSSILSFVPLLYEHKYQLILLQNFTVHYWMNKGADPRKLVLGVPFYGQSFSLEDGAGTGLGSPTYAGGEAGDETRARGFLSYYEVLISYYDFTF
jgi:chitinase